MSGKELPIFKNEEEEIEFWETHSSVDYLEESNRIELDVTGLRKRRNRMLVKVSIDSGSFKLNKLIDAKDETDLIEQAKRHVAKEIGGLKGIIVKRMRNDKFMREVVTRYNEKFKKDSPIPDTPAKFLAWAEKEKLVEVLER
jgi:hypothetical protein